MRLPVEIRERGQSGKIKNPHFASIQIVFRVIVVHFGDEFYIKQCKSNTFFQISALPRPIFCAVAADFRPAKRFIRLIIQLILVAIQFFREGKTNVGAEKNRLRRGKNNLRRGKKTDFAEERMETKRIGWEKMPLSGILALHSEGERNEILNRELFGAAGENGRLQEGGVIDGDGKRVFRPALTVQLRQ